MEAGGRRGVLRLVPGLHYLNPVKRYRFQQAPCSTSNLLLPLPFELTATFSLTNNKSKNMKSPNHPKLIIGFAFALRIILTRPHMFMQQVRQR